MDAIGLDGEPSGHRADADGQPHARRQARAHEQAYRQAITLTDLLDEVPIDSARFFFNQRESSSTLDFDWTWPCATTARTRSTMCSTPTRASARC